MPTGIVEELFIAPPIGGGDKDVWFRNYSVASPLNVRSQLDADPESVVWGEDQASFCVRTTNNSYYRFTIPRASGSVFPPLAIPAATLFGINPIRPSESTIPIVTQTRKDDTTTYCVDTVPDPDTLSQSSGQSIVTLNYTVGDFCALSLMTDVRYALNADKHLILFVTAEGLGSLFNAVESHAFVVNISLGQVIWTSFVSAITMVRTTIGGYKFNIATPSTCALFLLDGTGLDPLTGITFSGTSAGQTIDRNTLWTPAFATGTDYAMTPVERTQYKRTSSLTPPDQCPYVFTNISGSTLVTNPGPWVYQMRVSSDVVDGLGNPIAKPGLYPICATNPNMSWLLLVRRWRNIGGGTQYQNGVFYMRRFGTSVVTRTIREFTTDDLNDEIVVMTANKNHVLWYIDRETGADEIYITWLKRPGTSLLVGTVLSTFQANYFRLIDGPVDRPQDLLWLGADPGAGSFIEAWETDGTAILVSAVGYPFDSAYDPVYGRLVALPNGVSAPVIPSG